MNWKIPSLVIVVAFLASAFANAQAVLTINGVDVTISDGGSMIVNGSVENQNNGLIELNGDLILIGDLENNGGNAFSIGMGTVILQGTSQQAITGADAITLGSVMMNNAAGVLLENDLSVQGDLDMTQGDINLNGFDIDLGPNGQLLNESETSKVTGNSGRLRISRTLNAPAAENVGGLGLVLTSSSNLGMTTLERGHADQMGAGNPSVARYFDVTPDNNTDLDATLRFYYLDSETNGQSEGGFILYRSTDDGATWSTEGGDVNAGDNYVELSGIEALSRWTISNEETNPLTGLFEQAREVISLHVFPQPTRAETAAFLQGLPQGEYDLLLLDATGKVLRQIRINSFDSSDNILLPLNGLSAGQYFFQAVSTDRQQFATGELIIVK
jgi:hypothetical protein